MRMHVYRKQRRHFSRCGLLIYREKYLISGFVRAWSSKCAGAVWCGRYRNTHIATIFMTMANKIILNRTKFDYKTVMSPFYSESYIHMHRDTKWKIKNHLLETTWRFIARTDELNVFVRFMCAKGWFFKMYTLLKESTKLKYIYNIERVPSTGST